MSHPKSGEARSTVAVASELLDHEMTMSMASSKHLKSTEKAIQPNMM